MRWEYLIIKPHEDLEKREFAFNVMGAEKWELACFDNKGNAHFKRALVVLGIYDDEVQGD